MAFLNSAYNNSNIYSKDLLRLVLLYQGKIRRGPLKSLLIISLLGALLSVADQCGFIDPDFALSDASDCICDAVDLFVAISDKYIICFLLPLFVFQAILKQHILLMHCATCLCHVRRYYRPGSKVI